MSCGITKSDLTLTESRSARYQNESWLKEPREQLNIAAQEIEIKDIAMVMQARTIIVLIDHRYNHFQRWS